MSSPSDSFGRLSDIDLPSAEEMEVILREARAAGDESNDEFVRYLRDSDRTTPTALFDDPPERFVARLSYGDLVYCWLIEEQDTHLVYLCQTGGYHSVVYVYSERCQHQRHLIQSVYGSDVGDFRVVPITNRLSRSQSARDNQIDWSVWVFHNYFGFAYLPWRG